MTSVVFFGSSEYSVIVLKSLIQSFSVALVVTKIDKPFGRNQEVTANPVARFSLENGLPLYQTDTFDDNFLAKIKSVSADIGLCVAFGPPFFTSEIINLFPHKIVNIHPSPLPWYRGATPAPWQIINGETVSAVSFFQIDELPDHGPIISQIRFPISPDETSHTLYTTAFNLAANNLKSVLQKYLASPNDVTPQNHSAKTYYPKLTKNMGKINWQWEPKKIYRFINALQPWPIAWTEIISKDGTKLKMKVFSASLLLQKLQLEKVQIEGKKPTFWSEISSHYSLILENS